MDLHMILHVCIVQNAQLSLFRRLVSTLIYYIRTLKSVPTMEVSLFQSILIMEVAL